MLHHSRSLKSYTKSYYGKLLLAIEASERHGYCKTLSPPYEDNSLLVWDIKCRSYKDFKHGWMTRVFLYACMTTLAVSLIILLFERNFTCTPQYIFTELCLTEYRNTFVFTLCLLIWYTVYCLHFSMKLAHTHTEHLYAPHATVWIY